MYYPFIICHNFVTPGPGLHASVIEKRHTVSSRASPLNQHWPPRPDPARRSGSKIEQQLSMPLVTLLHGTAR